jgi:enamine deaminase RidA (YjgF/YER057c/UK114 family)
VNQDIDLERLVPGSVGAPLLSTIEHELGSLDRVVRVVKLLCTVRATPSFGQSPEVTHGCSEQFVEVFGDAGRHAPSAVGILDLPRGIAAEIEAIVEVRD